MILSSGVDHPGPMAYLVRPGAGPLAALVESFWFFEGDHPSQLETVLPSGSMQLLVNLDADRLRWFAGPRFGAIGSISGAGLSGCQLQRFAIDLGEQRRMAGVRFKPGGVARFLRVPAQEILDHHVALEDLWRDGRTVRDQLLGASGDEVLSTLERELFSRLGHPGSLDTSLDWAIAALSRGTRVGTVVDRLGWTSRRFISRFEERVGLKPKTFARLSRFHRARELGRTRDWAVVAADAGYADQAHLIREFIEFSGTTPTRWEEPPVPEPV